MNDRAGYYRNARPEVAALVPAAARYVVDVGCGAGVLGRTLKADRPGLEVRGVEPVAAQAELARQVLDDVHVGGAEDPWPAHWPNPDCVILADVLEHLVDPWRVVRAVRDLLPPGGKIVASIPNVAHVSVIRGLLRSRWDYRDAGILDRTHLRFFTRETAIELLEQGGFTVRSVERVVDSWAPVRHLVRARRAESRKSSVWGVLADALTNQLLIVAD